jgi:hypothetical protein
MAPKVVPTTPKVVPTTATDSVLLLVLLTDVVVDVKSSVDADVSVLPIVVVVVALVTNGHSMVGLHEQFMGTSQQS